MRTIYRLSKLAVDRAKKPGRYADGGGLYLEISNGKRKRGKAGNRTWVFRYQRDGVEKKMGLGPLHTVSLSEAREKARKLRQQLLDGLDPLGEKQKRRLDERIAVAAAITFKDAAEQYISTHEKSWKNQKHRDQWRSTLENFAYPVIGDLPVAAVETNHILKIIQPHWEKKRETAGRVRGRIERILDWCIAREFRSGLNPARWQGHLKKLLPQGRKVSKHHAALPYLRLPAFMADLRSNESLSALALQFTILTAARTGETIDAKWKEIDEKERVWTCPAERTKSGRPHRVPLSDPALAILKKLRPKTDDPNGLIFPLSNMAMLKFLKERHPELTVHGFRSTFRDWCKERTNFPREIAELALAHVIADKTEAAYARGDALEKRRRLMASWATFCASPPRGVEAATPLHTEVAA